MAKEAAGPKHKRARVTIADVAERAGVTRAAVSMAVNGKPGVSDETRARILRIVDELGWRPSRTAQTLRGRSPQTIGLVLARPEEVVGQEAFFARFITGVQSELSKHGFSLQLQMAADLDAESAIHAEWIADGRVDGVLVLDPRINDPRVSRLNALRTPTLVVGGDYEGPALASVRTDDGRLMRVVLDHLIGLGHRMIGYVTGDQSFAHVRNRIDAFADHTLEAGVWGVTLAGDFAPQRAKKATRRLLLSPRRPTALIYDSEVMAIAGMATLTELGLTVPHDVSVVSWEDSPICEVLHPSLTALNRDAITLGKLAAVDLLHLLADEPLEQVGAEPAITARESTTAPRDELAPEPGGSAR